MLRDVPRLPTSSAGPAEPLPPLGIAARAPAERPRRAPSFFVHEPFAAPRTSGLRVGVIADGTTRGGPNGVAEGARRIVECAERCAERGDVAALAAFILSPQNVTRRKKPFFAALHTQFLRLLEGVVSRRCLVGIRVEAHGRLDRLERKGGAAARLAHVLDLLVEATRSTPDPRLRLVFCIDYDEDAPLALDLDILLRTGMEAPSALRLSGLRVNANTICIPSTKLWRDFTSADLDQALDLAVRSPRVDLAPGFSSGFVAGLLSELSRADLPSPLRITLPLAAPLAETLAALESAASSAAPPGGVAVITAEGLRARSRRFGPRRAPVQLVLVGPGERPWSPRRPPLAWIAPGQPGSVFRLRDLRAGDANVHPCEPTPEGVVDGLRRALRFHASHPPLHGAPRPLRRAEPEGSDRMEELIERVSERAHVPAETLARALGGRDRPDPCLTGEVLAAKCLSDARAAGLFSGEVDWRRQAVGYALTAFVITFRRPPAAGPAAGDWEPPARTLARVMLVLASSDEEISDRVFPGETAAARRARLAVSVEYLIARLRGERRDAPAVHGAATLSAVARAWDTFFEEHARTSHPEVLSAVRRSAEALYRANLDELSRGDPPVARSRPRGEASRRTPEEVASSIPEPVERRLRELAHTLSRGGDHRRSRDPQRADALRELRLLRRLTRVAPSIGAGCALLAMAATEAAHAVPPGGVAALLRASPLIDHAFRLANDLSFDDATRGDRDAKPTCFTCLIPEGLAGKAREQACVDALRTCRSTAAWLDAEVERALDDLARCWPLAACWLRRGVRAGRRAYEDGHYDRLHRGAWARIVAEIEGEDPA